MANPYFYSEKYYDEQYEYRHVIIDKETARQIPTDRTLLESEWRGLGIKMSKGWVHYAWYKPEPHILLFRRPLGTDPTTGLVNEEEAKKIKKYIQDGYHY